jgi:hypothetical protein
LQANGAREYAPDDGLGDATQPMAVTRRMVASPLALPRKEDQFAAKQ